MSGMRRQGVILPHCSNDPQGRNSTLIKRDDGNLPWSSACVACHAVERETRTSLFFEGANNSIISRWNFSSSAAASSTPPPLILRIHPSSVQHLKQEGMEFGKSKEEQ